MQSQVGEAGEMHRKEVLTAHGQSINDAGIWQSQSSVRIHPVGSLASPALASESIRKP